MAEANEKKPTRRRFLKKAATIAVGAAALGTAGVWLGSVRRVSRAAGKKIIIIGIDGMDPRLSESMMREGRLPHLEKLSAAGGFSALGTSIPPQSPVAWANFINGAGPGSHGIFDFIHRHADKYTAFNSISETLPGAGGWEVGDHNIPLNFWPFNHKPPETVLRRQGTPFWDYLDAAGIPSTFYDLPSNYPPSPSQHGHHRCLCGMGTPDMIGDYPTYQYFAEDGPEKPKSEEGGVHAQLPFDGDTARVKIRGPKNSLLADPKPIYAELVVHRDRDANAAVIEVQGRRLVLRRGEWSRWTQLDFDMTAPWFLPNKTITGICRFYLRDVSPKLRIYVSPININPADPAAAISEPASFISDVAGRIGPFYTTGFKEDYSARKDNLFNDDEFLRQANLVLDERLKLLEDAMQNYDDGVLFFYFSSSDLQSHIFFWEPGEPHPIRTEEGAAAHAHRYVRQLYERLDKVIGDIYDRYGAHATIIVMSDHGFANFGWQFNLTRWLRDNDYLQPGDCESLQNVDWSQTRAYGLGINGLYLNLKGRERDGIVDPSEKEDLITRLTNGLKDVELGDRPVIRNVYRADEVYKGPALALAPDLIIGYHRGFRASWTTCLGNIGRRLVDGELRAEEALSANDKAWSADHCVDALEVPGVLWSNRTIRRRGPALVDIAPSILAEYGLATPATMTGRNVFEG
jgi:predicted AlkP superfamily phosphohydrolase/phosphomutase